MPKGNFIPDMSALTFFNCAREYHNAANELFDVHPESVSRPLNFLYFHTIELAFKAFLRACNVPILGTKAQTHKLTKLYERCRRLGLTIGSSDRFEIGNIVNLLEHGNEYQGFRYVNPNLSVMAQLSWTRDVVKQLMSTVEPFIVAQEKENPVPVKLLIIVCGQAQ